MSRRELPMTAQMRDLLIRHLPGPQPMLYGRREPLRAVVKGALAKELLWRDPRPPQKTYLTDLGRASLMAALSDWADAFLRVGYGVDEDAPSTHIAAKGKLIPNGRAHESRGDQDGRRGNPVLRLPGRPEPVGRDDARRTGGQ